MVEIYYGRAAAGKTNTLMSRLESEAANGKKVCLVVPEQLSLTREYYVSKSGFSNISVLSFSRLANTIFRSVGGTAKKLPDNVMNACAVFCAITNCYDRLVFYKSIAFSHGFITSLIAVFSEFDNNCINEDAVMSIPDSEWSARSKNKYRDLFMIYKEYKSLWQGEYKVPGNDIVEAAARLELCDMFADTVFAFDGFFGFTAQQMLLIRQILLQSPTSIFCFTTDLESDVFTTVTLEAEKIINECKKLKLECNTQKIENSGYVERASALEMLEKTAFEPIVKEGEADGEGITVFGAKNISDELNFIACKIKNDVLDKKYAYNDIAVLCPDVESIKHMAVSVFEKHGIPIFADTSKALISTQLCAFVTTALDIANSGFEFDSVFAFLKTGLCGVSFDKINLLENYVRMWKIRGRAWADEWTKNPNGIDSYTDSSVPERLKELNNVREKIYIPLKRFCDAVSKKRKGAEFLRAIYKLCADFNVSENLDATAEQFYNQGNMQLYYEYTRVFSVFISMLDSIYEMCADTVFGVKRFYDLFCISAMSVNIMSRPSRTNEVLFSGIGRVRAENKKCIYIPQMNAAVIPSPSAAHSLITEADKRVFALYDIQVSLDVLSKAMREYFDFYYATSTPSHELVLSYSHFSMSGDMGQKSEYLAAIQKATGVMEITKKDLPCEFYLVSVAGAEQVLDAEQGVKQALKEISGVDFNLKSESTTLSDEVVELLYSKNLKLSFSGMEEYINCPFKFFLNRGLRLKEQQQIEFDSGNIGTFVHDGLEKLLKNGYDITDPENVKETIKKISQDYYEQELLDCNGLSPRFDYMFNNIKNSLEDTALNVVDEINNSDYKPTYFELEVADYTPPIDLGNGYTLKLTGKIDRVDMTDDGSAKIVDYKTGSQKFSLKTMYNGLSLQLPVYAYAVKSKEKDVKISALYYLKSGVATPPKKSAVPLSDDAYKKELEKYYVRDGIFCSDEDSLKKMDRRGKMFENIKAERLVSQKAIDSLVDFAVDKIKSTGKNITSGVADISPICDREATACKWCAYKSICGIDEKEHLQRKLQPVGEEFLGEN